MDYRMHVRRLYSLVALLAIACHDTTGPSLRGTVFVLRSIAGQPLPAPYAQYLPLQNRMFADTLVLGDDGKGEWRAVIEESFGGAKQHLIEQLTYTGTHHIELSFVCPPGADCIAPPHFAGDVTATGILFSESRVMRTPLVFERIRP